MLKTRVVSNTATFGVRGIPIDLGTAQAVGITVDNFSNRWLTIGTQGLFVPPSVVGWASNLYGSQAGSIQVFVGAPPGVTQLLSTQNGTVVVAIYDTEIPSSPCIAFSGPQYRNTFTAGGTGSGPKQLTAANNFYLTVFPFTPTIYRVTRILIMPTTLPAAINTLQWELVTISTDGTNAPGIITTISGDDTGAGSNSTMRGISASATAGFNNVLRDFYIDMPIARPIIDLSPFEYVFNQSGPEAPYGAQETGGNRKEGFGLWLAAATTVGGVDRYYIEAEWTEELVT